MWAPKTCPSQIWLHVADAAAGAAAIGCHEVLAVLHSIVDPHKNELPTCAACCAHMLRSYVRAHLTRLGIACAYSHICIRDRHACFSRQQQSQNAAALEEW